MTDLATGSEAQAIVATQVKDASQLRQKRMIADHYKRLFTAREDGRKVVYTFVPGNLTELTWACRSRAIWAPPARSCPPPTCSCSHTPAASPS